MDPRIAWYQPEQVCSAVESWDRCALAALHLPGANPSELDDDDLRSAATSSADSGVWPGRGAGGGDKTSTASSSAVGTSSAPASTFGADDSSNRSGARPHTALALGGNAAPPLQQPTLGAGVVGKSADGKGVGRGAQGRSKTFYGHPYPRQKLSQPGVSARHKEQDALNDDSLMSFLRDAENIAERRAERNRACTYGFNRTRLALTRFNGGMPWTIKRRLYQLHLATHKTPPTPASWSDLATSVLYNSLCRRQVSSQRQVPPPPASWPTSLHEEICDFVDWIEPTQEEFLIRHVVFDQLKTKIMEFLGNSVTDVDYFGSFRTGIFLPTSDIDVVVLGTWPDRDSLPLRELAEYLQATGIAHKSSIKVLDKASVPIIKIVDLETDIRVDISFNMKLVVNSANMILRFLDEWRPLRPLVYVLKQFLLQRDLNEVFTGGVSSYSLILMAVRFLQHFAPRRPPEWADNLALVLLEFLEFYGKKFNYVRVGIRVSSGGAFVPKQQLVSRTGGPCSVLCIEDPLQSGNDIGRSSYGMFKVRDAFTYAYGTLLPAVLTTDDCGAARMWRDDGSILGRIIRITDAVIEYRDTLRERLHSYRSLSHAGRMFAQLCVQPSGQQGAFGGAGTEPTQRQTQPHFALLASMGLSYRGGANATAARLVFDAHRLVERLNDVAAAPGGGKVMPPADAIHCGPVQQWFAQMLYDSLQREKCAGAAPPLALMPDGAAHVDAAVVTQPPSLAAAGLFTPATTTTGTPDEGEVDVDDIYDQVDDYVVEHEAQVQLDHGGGEHDGLDGGQVEIGELGGGIECDNVEDVFETPADQSSTTGADSWPQSSPPPPSSLDASGGGSPASRVTYAEALRKPRQSSNSSTLTSGSSGGSCGAKGSLAAECVDSPPKSSTSSTGAAAAAADRSSCVTSPSPPAAASLDTSACSGGDGRPTYSSVLARPASSKRLAPPTAAAAANSAVEPGDDTLAACQVNESNFLPLSEILPSGAAASATTSASWPSAATSTCALTTASGGGSSSSSTPGAAAANCSWSHGSGGGNWRDRGPPRRRATYGYAHHGHGHVYGGAPTTHYAARRSHKRGYHHHAAPAVYHAAEQPQAPQQQQPHQSQPQHGGTNTLVFERSRVFGRTHRSAAALHRYNGGGGGNNGQYAQPRQQERRL